MTVLWVGVFWGFLYVPRLKKFLPKEKSIAILAWPTDIDPQAVRAFEKETGIKVYLNYFEDYEEFFIKLKTARGEGYDLITPADYVVPSLIKEGLLKKIDKTKLPFWTSLRENLIGLYYDRDNAYTIPYFWGIYGIGYNKNHFQTKPPATWGLIFDPSLMPKNIGMLDDARESIFIVAQYLFGHIDSINSKQLDAIKNLLLTQKKRVLTYTDMRATYLLTSGSCPVALTIGYEVARAMRAYPMVDFMIPREGSFLLVDNFALPASSTKEDLVYQFLAFLYRPQQLAALVEKHLFYPPTTAVAPSSYLPLPTREQLARADFFRNVLPKKSIDDVWIALKA
jgi:spermidine/putrescine transport system substrate-binding protein